MMSNTFLLLNNANIFLEPLAQFEIVNYNSDNIINIKPIINIINFFNSIISKLIIWPDFDYFCNNFYSELYLWTGLPQLYLNTSDFLDTLISFYCQHTGMLNWIGTHITYQTAFYLGLPLPEAEDSNVLEFLRFASYYKYVLAVDQNIANIFASYKEIYNWSEIKDIFAVSHKISKLNNTNDFWALSNRILLDNDLINFHKILYSNYNKGQSNLYSFYFPWSRYEFQVDKPLSLKREFFFDNIVALSNISNDQVQTYTDLVISTYYIKPVQSIFIFSEIFLNTWNIIAQAITYSDSSYFNLNKIDSLLCQIISSNNSNTELVYSTVYINNTVVCYLLVIFVLFFLVLVNTKKNLYVIPTSWQFVFSNLYTFVLNIIDTQVGKQAQRFFPYVFTIFIVILIANLLGMTLYAFTLTSHIMVTFTLGVSSFIGLTILGFVLQKLAFFNLFLPKGIPVALIPILVVVELISYTSRALSLSIRLFANLMSGHTLLHILAFFASKLCKFNYIIGLLGFALIVAIIMLELCIAVLQAYVFTILICIYLNDAFNSGH